MSPPLWSLSVVADVDVLGNGAVVLSKDVVCDGFLHGCRVRVQTHVHDDHMDDFDTSKGFQHLVMSEATRELLVAERDADLPYRDNVIALAPDESYEVGQSRVSLVSSDHMLGSCQVIVERPDGLRVGYSGDFQWPMRSPIEVDVLVLDSTYGSPESIRDYDQAEAEARFVEIVLSRVKSGCVHIKAHRGTIQRAIHLLGSELRQPIICSRKLCDEVDVYQRFGAAVADVMRADTAYARDLMREGRYVRMYSKGDGDPVENPRGVTITLSAFMMPRGQPVLEYSERACRIALSNHADFEGTLEYVKATRARRVVTDNTRGPHAVVLAQELASRLGLDANPSTSQITYRWGGR